MCSIYSLLVISFTGDIMKSNTLTKILICTIIVLSCLIYTGYNKNNKDKFIKEVFKESIDYSNFNNFYEKTIGNIKEPKKEILTFDEKLQYKSITNKDNYYELIVDNMQSVPVLSSGIIVFIGEKENLGNTVIIQGNDGVDIWYSNIDMTDYSLYDYVSINNTLGYTKNDKLYLTFIKNGKNISYEKYLK